MKKMTLHLLTERDFREKCIFRINERVFYFRFELFRFKSSNLKLSLKRLDNMRIYLHLN